MVMFGKRLRWMALAAWVAAPTVGPCAAGDGAVHEADGASRREQLFYDAARAYNENRLEDAVANYRRLVDHGYVSPELFYNFGNALFRAGQTARAVLYYRKAWVLSPSDPDIEANLLFALRQAGAPPPRMNAFQRAASAFSPHTWGLSALALYWLSMIGFIAYLLTRRRRWVARVAAISLLGAVACAMPLTFWVRYHRRPEAVVMRARPALYAPLEDATERFSLPEGALVRVIEHSGNWVKIAYRGNTGWIAENDCISVLPL